jgi:KDO2-lipid IV(A) lauroyltransferase
VASSALWTFRLASTAARLVPLNTLGDVAEWAGTRFGPRFLPAETDQLTRHVRRAAPDLSAEEAAVVAARGVGSYARYWVESFRLPRLSSSVIDRGFAVSGYHRIEAAFESGVGPIVVLPHLGAWEWAAAWLDRVKGERVTAVVERLEPADVFEWFVRLRRGYGIDVVPAGPDAMTRLVAAVRDRRIVCLLSDRDLSGNGVEVEFFSERTTLPAGPALLARRTGAPLLPAAVYFRGRGRLAVVGPAVQPDLSVKLRQDIARMTQELATALEGLIAEAPDQWHLLGPNWPSDRAGDETTMATREVPEPSPSER